jgi:catechol 2,3-dioxygenase-like lactoylglutathione lyase family enzyme
MTSSIIGVDHCVILVRDLDTAQQAVERLGFTLTPRGVHSDHMGTHNHCIMLQHGYFEVLSILKPTGDNQRWRDAVEKREGLNAVALATDDARGGYRELRDNGVEMVEPVDFARPVDLPTIQGEASFTIAVIPEQYTPGTNMFLCQHHTRDLVWYPGSWDHANGAVGLAAVTAVADDPAAFGAAYTKVFGERRVRGKGDTLTIDSGDAPVHVFTRLHPGGARRALSRRLPRRRGAALFGGPDPQGGGPACHRGLSFPRGRPQHGGARGRHLRRADRRLRRPARVRLSRADRGGRG